MLNICIINKQIAYDKTSPIRAFVCLYLNIHLYTLICICILICIIRYTNDIYINT